MKFCAIFTLTCLLLIGEKAYTQYLFIDEADWYDESTSISELAPFERVVGDTIGIDSLNISYFFDNAKKAIEGQYFINKYKKYSKYGTWTFYYSDGKIQSEREYNEKGALVNVKSLLSPAGDSLSIGFPHRNKSKSYFGHQYRYANDGSLHKVVRYEKGFLVEEFEHDKYPASKLLKPQIKEYVISENETLYELSIEEAIELQKKDPKPIFMRATYRWNGWSKKMDKIFAIPDIAKLINDNYHLVYFDIGTPEDVNFELNGKQYSYESGGSGQYKMHKFYSQFLKNSSPTTPAYLLLDTDLKVLAKSKGASITQEKFEHHLRYFLDGHYNVMSYGEYNPDEK